MAPVELDCVDLQMGKTEVDGHHELQMTADATEGTRTVVSQTSWWMADLSLGGVDGVRSWLDEGGAAR